VSEELRALGWDDAWEAARLAADPDGAWQPVRIAAEHRGANQALGPGGVGWVELTGKLYNEANDKRALPTVGDWVLVERWEAAVADSGAAVVRALLPRRSFLVRKAAGEATAPQPLAANVDVGLVMTSANSDLSPARLDRYIGLLRDGGIEPVLVLSKIDLVADPSPGLAALAKIAAVRVIALSSTQGHGLDELRSLGGPGRTCVLLGSSGVGKSTLLNALLGTNQETRELRGDERGRHTTTRRELFVSSAGGLWIDTPGMRELAQWVEDEEEVAFDDIAELAAGCKFRDCRHEKEPGCAVRAAVAPERLASFHKLAGERAVGVTKQSEAQRIAASRKARAKKPGAPSDD
jgi:ribosome biogenesis GTPase